MQAPLALFVWGKNRIVPVRVTDFSITEEAFDPSLNPIRAKVSLGLRVLSIDDLGFSTTRAAASSWPTCRARSSSPTKVQSASFATLGIGGIG